MCQWLVVWLAKYWAWRSRTSTMVPVVDELVLGELTNRLEHAVAGLSARLVDRHQ